MSSSLELGSGALFEIFISPVEMIGNIEIFISPVEMIGRLLAMFFSKSEKCGLEA